MKKLLLVIIICQTYTLFSQTYEKMLYNENAWYYLDAFESATTWEYRTIGDTTYMGENYKKVYYGYPNNLFLTKPYFLIREDTLARQIFMVPNYGAILDTTEYLVYDFNINVGDTIEIACPNFYFKSAAFYNYTLDSISFLSNIGNSNRVYYLRNVDVLGPFWGDYPVWVEGVGSLAGIDFNWRNWNMPEINTLICAYKDTIQTIYFEPMMYPAHNCNVFHINVEELEGDEKFHIYPNPSTGKINIEAEGIENIKVMNLQGKKVLKQEVESRKTEVDLSHLVKGIYIIKVQTSKGVAVEKIILN